MMAQYKKKEMQSWEIKENELTASVLTNQGKLAL